MNSVLGLFFGLAEAIVLIYLPDCSEFSVLVDPFIIVMALPAALAGVVWMLFLTHTTLSCSGADRRHHVHGRSDREQRSGRQFCARAAGATGKMPSRPRSRPASLASVL